MTLFIVGYSFYAIGENFMAAFLPELAAHRDMGKVSAFGWTLGYVGGLTCLAGAALITTLVPGPTGYRLVCLWAGGFFLLAALPTFLLLGERKQREQMPAGQNLLTVGFCRLGETFRAISHYRQLFRYLAIMTFYLGGMQIVIWFAGSIAKKLFGLSDQQMAVYILVLTVTAVAGAPAHDHDRFGPVACRHGGGTVRTAGAPVHVLGDGQRRRPWHGRAGDGQPRHGGAVQPAAQGGGVLRLLRPGLGTKLAAVLGLVLSIVAEKLFPNNYNLVVASSGIFFIGGLVLMLTVDEEAGRRAATEAAAEHVRKHHDYKGEIPTEE
jgi:UMF1 family MFS transporter